MIGAVIPDDQTEAVTDQQLSMVDEALVAGTIANTNGLLVILAKLVAKGVFDQNDLHAFSDSYSKPLDHVGMRALAALDEGREISVTSATSDRILRPSRAACPPLKAIA